MAQSNRPQGKQSPLDRLLEQPTLLGLFLPTQSGGWTPSPAPRGTDWQFGYNARLTQQAERAGFDLVFALAQWLGAGGWGGEMRYREISIDPLMVTAGLVGMTKHIVLISTVHVLYGWHPLHLAKFGATLDHMSRGRWGLNLVTGFVADEIRRFGMHQAPHDERYVMAGEFADMMQAFWQSETNVTLNGKYWASQEGFVSPKPLFGRPIMVNAGSSEAGIQYAARHSDLLFITSPAGAALEASLAVLPAHNARIKAAAKKEGRTIRTLINPHVICRDTEAEVREIRDAIVAGEDPGAVNGLLAGFNTGDQSSWRGHARDQRIIGGNLHIFGTPDQVVDAFIALNKAGCDGFQLNFFDFEPDLAYFCETVIPRMREAGLRH